MVRQKSQVTDWKRGVWPLRNTTNKTSKNFLVTKQKDQGKLFSAHQGVSLWYLLGHFEPSVIHSSYLETPDFNFAIPEPVGVAGINDRCWSIICHQHICIGEKICEEA